MKTAIITGVYGQDGSILAELLLDKGFKVVGVDMWSATNSTPNIKTASENENFSVETGDITEKEFIEYLFRKHNPDWFFNMAAISLVPESFKIPRRIMEVNTMAVLNILETIRYHSPHTHFYQASSSEQIGKNIEIPQNTESKMIPNSPYAISKLASYHFTRLYREAYGLFAVNGMLWNHEGERRGPTFVTRKITMAVDEIKWGLSDFVELGNLDARRDWGYARDYCEAMIMMMEADKPDDYAVATGESHSIREFVEEAFKYIGLTITWEGKGLDEVGKDQNGVVRVKINPTFYRPAEVPLLFGDYSKTKEKLGWEPKVKFNELVKIMMEHELEY